jgi:CubicO group peptidase (beta-lactamase class C family)
MHTAAPLPALVLPLILPLALFQSPASAPQDDPDVERLGQLARALGREAVEKEGVPGIAIAVAREGEIVASAHLGWADPERGVVVEASTRFPIGSLTRQFTAATVLRLSESKRLELDDPLTKHLPAFPAEGGVPTLRQLLANRSGLPGWRTLLTAHPEAAHTTLSEEQFVQMLGGAKRAFAPGSGHSNDTLGYALLALVVQKVEGKPFEEALRAGVIEPAGLEETDFCPASRRQVGFAADCKSVDEIYECELAPAIAPGGAARGLCATAADVLRWQAAVHGRMALSDKGLALFLAPSGSAKGPDEHGCAVQTDKLEGQLRHALSGASGGFRVRAAYYPGEKLGVVVLANCATAEVERIEEELARVAHGLAPRSNEFPLTREEEERLPGVYQLATARIRVFLREGHLWIEEPGEEAQHLRSRGRGEFAVGKTEARVVFDLEGERAAWFQLVRGGTRSRAVRVE